MIAPAHLERRVLCQHLARLGQLGLAAEHESGQDQRLRTRAAFGEATCDQQLIDPDFGGFHVTQFPTAGL